MPSKGEHHQLHQKAGVTNEFPDRPLAHKFLLYQSLNVYYCSNRSRIPWFPAHLAAHFGRRNAVSRQATRTCASVSKRSPKHLLFKKSR